MLQIKKQIQCWDDGLHFFKKGKGRKLEQIGITIFIHHKSAYSRTDVFALTAKRDYSNWDFIKNTALKRNTERHVIQSKTYKLHR